MKTSTCSVLFATLLALAIPRRTEAHGFVSQVQIQGGATFKGPKPGATGANNSPIRGITDQSPVKNLQSKDLICGMGATAGSAVASAKPGDTLVYSWANNVAEDGNWIHDTGPMMTYFAQVPAGQTADKFDGVGAQWFKTDEAGKKNNKWVQASLMTGATFKTQIPETLPDGDYLVRHEIIALHNAANKGGVEFYPSCFQIRIKNSNAGNATVTATPTLSFPGAYTATDPGLLVNVFSQAADGSEYKFPAGPVAQVSAPGSTGTSPDVLASQSTTSSVEATSVASATSTSSTSTAAVSSTTSIATSATPISSTFTASAAPTSTPAPTGLQAIRLANGRAAQELNLRFRTLSVSDKCEPREPGCIGGQFASCSAQGTWAIQGACFSGASCFAVPLRNINGTQVGCFPESVVEQELVDAGVGTAIASETSTATSPVVSASVTSTVTLTATATSAVTGTSSVVQVTGTPASSTRISTSTASSISASVPISTNSSASSVTPTATPVSNAGGSPAVVVGVGSRPARRMLRWERRGMNMRF